MLIRQFVKIYNHEPTNDQIPSAGATVEQFEWEKLLTLSREEIEKEIEAIKVDKSIYEPTKRYVIGFLRTSLPQLPPLSEEEFDSIVRPLNQSCTIETCLEDHLCDILLKKEIKESERVAALTLITCSAIRGGAPATFELFRYLRKKNYDKVLKKHLYANEIERDAVIDCCCLLYADLDYMKGQIDYFDQLYKNDFWMKRCQGGGWNLGHKLSAGLLPRMYSLFLAPSTSALIAKAKQALDPEQSKLEPTSESKSESKLEPKPKDHITAADCYYAAAEATSELSVKLQYYVIAFEQTKLGTLQDSSDERIRIRAEVQHALRKLIEQNKQKLSREVRPELSDAAQFAEQLQTEYKKCNEYTDPYTPQQKRNKLKEFAKSLSIPFEPVRAEEKEEHKQVTVVAPTARQFKPVEVEAAIQQLAASEEEVRKTSIAGITITA